MALSFEIRNTVHTPSRIPFLSNISNFCVCTCTVLMHGAAQGYAPLLANQGLEVHPCSRGCVEGQESTKEPDGSDTESLGMCHVVEARKAETSRRQVTSEDIQR